MMSIVSTELVLRDSEAGDFAYYSWQNIVIACWSKQGTGASIQRFARVRETMARLHPEGVSVICLIADGAGLPTPEARAGAQELMERYRDKRAVLAVVIHGEGFWVSAMRAATNGVHALLHRSIPMKIFNEVDGVVDWLPMRHERQTGVRVKPVSLLHVLRELSAAL